MERTGFERLEYSAVAHFRLSFFGAVLRLMSYLRETFDGDADGGAARLFERFPFLENYAADVRRFLPPDTSGDAAPSWWDAEVARWESNASVHLPLAALARHGIDTRSRTALLLAGLVEEDSRFGDVYAWLCSRDRRPTIETLGHVLAFDNGADGWAVCHPLITAGLVEVSNEQMPRSEWLLRVPSVLWDAVRGSTDAHPLGWCRTAAADLPSFADLAVHDRLRARLQQVPAVVRQQQVRTVIVRGTPGSDRLLAIQAIARAMGCGTVEIPAAAVAERTWSVAGPLCALTASLPVVVWDGGPGDTLEVPPIPGYGGAVAVAMGLEGGVTGWTAERAATLTIPDLTAPERERVWSAALGDRAGADLASICERFHLPGGYIRRTAIGASANAALDGRDAVTLEDVRSACRLLNRQLLDTLATRLDATAAWSHLVVSDGTAAKLRELERRCRHRERLLDRLGPGFAGGNRGVRALFTGPSGTGKTLAAKILAGPSGLGMDLHRADLAAIVNRYIGETEKNLHHLLTRAEELDVVLLLDEGDALLGARTEVRSSTDRYANLETNYLLQRLETYQGIVIVTTNAAEHIDPAFQRRMDVVVNFVLPQAPQRWRIWRLHLPHDHAVEDAFLDEIAQRCAFTGGQIRNAAQLATLLALDEQSAVRRRHVMHAIDSEYRKAGATSPLRDVALAAAPEASMRAFINTLSV